MWIMKLYEADETYRWRRWGYEVVHSVLHVVQLGEGYAPPAVRKGSCKWGHAAQYIDLFFELRKNVPNDLTNQLIDDL